MEREVFTVYKQYYAIGKNDHANRRKMVIPDALPEQDAFRGYMDGYAGCKEVEPSKASAIVFKPRITIN